MRVLFIVVWLLAIGFVAWCHWHAQPALAVALKAREFPLVAALIAVLPWSVGPGMLAALRRMKSGGINLPHAAYWFEGERRAASLDRFAPFADALGLLVTLLMTGLLALDVWHGQQGLPAPEGWQLAGTGLFALGLVVWTLALLRAFPAPAKR